MEIKKIKKKEVENEKTHSGLPLSLCFVCNFNSRRVGVVTNTPPLSHWGYPPPPPSHTHIQFFIEGNISVQPSVAQKTEAFCKEGFPALRSNQMFQIYKKVLSDCVNFVGFALPSAVTNT